MLCKYYSPVCTTATGPGHVASTLSQKRSCFVKPKRFAPALITETYMWSMFYERRGERLFGSWSLPRPETFASRTASPPRTPPPPSRLPSRQPMLRNGSLFKSFMSTPQKRKACRKLWDRNEEGVIAPLICDDLRHNACDWFDNQALFPFRRGRKVKSAIPTCFPFFSPSCVHRQMSFFPISKCFSGFSSLFSHDIPPSPLTHPINILLNSQIR